MVLCFIESMKKYESQSQLRGKERPLFGLWLKPKTKNIRIRIIFMIGADYMENSYKP